MTITMMMSGNVPTKLSLDGVRFFSARFRSSASLQQLIPSKTTATKTTRETCGGERLFRCGIVNHPYHLAQSIDKTFLHKSASNRRTMSTSVEYLCVHVFVTCKEGTEDAFLEASLANARESSKEEGISRFDVIQQNDDPTKFVLVEVYKNGDAPAKHKETAHYLKWRETVADMMAVPRSAIKYKNHFPAVSGGWDYPEGASLE
eukprot:CAMPEP_0185727574 /NCGR_PEP_ID=MMETSP1171-20130828/3219_1 /TAXON_ID=374046 /ORGANISM="Helicotheca tamensis, Strain CCMP826" /LENGTH=203 /DNA_ID=CAMNT_0028396167 /DNA_START=9 /DNA_END=620 /DNA_ORIENTATION=+